MDAFVPICKFSFTYYWSPSTSLGDMTPYPPSGNQRKADCQSDGHTYITLQLLKTNQFLCLCWAQINLKKEYKSFFKRLNLNIWYFT